MKKKLASDYDDRQYMQSKDYELYYYCDTKPSNRTILHTHPYYEFYFFLEGHAEAQIKNEHYMLSYGDILIVPPKIPHGIIVHDYDIPYRRFDFWVSVAMYNQLYTLSRDFSYVSNCAIKDERHIIHTDRITFNSVLSKMFSIIEEEKSDRFGKAVHLHLAVSDLVLTINRLAYEQFESRVVSQVSLYQNICSYIEHNIDEDLSLDNIAKHFFLSKFYISHVFKDNIGISIHQYVAKKRLQLCHDAITGGEAISKVFHTFGFDDYSCFYRAFKKEYGISPKELQKRASINMIEARNNED